MKIGLVTGEYPPMEGGVGAFTQELAQAMAELGHEIHIITSKAARPETASLKASEIKEPIDLPFAQLHPRVKKWKWAALSEVVDVAIRHELDIINIQYQAAAYHMGSAAINFLPWRLKHVVKTAVTFHDLRVPYLFPKAGGLRKTAVTFMAKQAHGNIATNPEDFAQLIQFPQTPARQIPIGSNITTYTPHHIEIAEARELLGVGEGDCLLGYFGFLNESKGADTLIASLVQLPETTHLVFIGGQTGASDPANNQSFLAQLHQQIKDLGLTERVHWTGFVDDQRVSTFLNAADLMVMPYRDGVSLRRGTLMAALAHGRPLISTHPQTATPELVHGKNCWLVPVDDVDALTQAIQTLWADGELRAKLGNGATAVADLFTWDKIAMQTLAFFQEIR
ncbi:MAG: glycosyltransferase family 4 protein [Anaerolineae bacterium]|nr:glycosyltransferase family 4 protein [Anaerolineae bacterium]